MLGVAERLRVMGSLALSLCHLAAGRVDAVCSLKPARSIDIAAAQLLVRERGYAIELFEDPPFAAAPLDLVGRSRVVAAATPALVRAVAAALPRCSRRVRRSRRTLVRSTVMAPDRDSILTALESVIDPELHKPVTELDMVRDVVVHPDGSVEVTVALTVAGCPMRSSFEDQVQRFVGAVDGVTSVELHFDVMSPDEKAALSTRLRGGRPEKTISLSPTTRVLAIASGRAVSASRRSPRISPQRSPRAARRSGCSTRTSTATRFRTCSASSSGRSWSTR